MRFTSKLLGRLMGALMGTSVGGFMGVSLAQTGSDELAWRDAANIGTLQSYENYLSFWPDGSYARDAFRCIVELSENLPRSSCTIEPGAGPLAQGGAERSAPVLVDVY